MIALAKKQNAQSLEDRFTDLLPTITDQLRFAFRHEPPERKEDMIAEAIASCWVAFIKLIERGLDEVIFGDWLQTLGGPRRRIAETLAEGQTTSASAAKFGASLGRISQLRRELHDDWEKFHGEDVADEGSSCCGTRIKQHLSLAAV